MNTHDVLPNSLAESNEQDLIKAKTDFITVTGAVNLDTVQSNVSTNNAKTGITTSQANAITANTAKNSFPTGDITRASGAHTLYNDGDAIFRNSSASERGRVHCQATIRGTIGSQAGWVPTGTGPAPQNKMIMECTATSGEGAGICISENATCIWNPDNGVYFVDEDSITSSSYAGYYVNLTQSGTLSTSDKRLKQKIEDLSFDRSILDIIDDIPVKKYFRRPTYNKFKEPDRYEKNKHKYENIQLGTIAQDLPQEIKDLGLVNSDNDNFPDQHYSVNYGRLIMIAIEGIKELKKEIDLLKNK